MDAHVRNGTGATRSEELAEFLARTARSLLDARPLTPEVQTLGVEACAMVRSQVFFNYMRSEDGFELAAWCGVDDRLARTLSPLNRETTVCGLVAARGRRVVVEDVFPAKHARTELISSLGVKAFACHPLSAAGEVIGTLAFGTTERVRFEDEELVFMESLADLLAMAAARQRAEAALSLLDRELERLVRRRTSALTRQTELLQDRNTALQEMLAQVERAREEVETNLLHNAGALLEPALQRLGAGVSGASLREVELLRENLKALTSPLSRRLSSAAHGLSPRELEICGMVRAGLSSKEIAPLLGLAPSTVETHRRRIRKKLGLTSRSHNLAAYLLSME